MSKKNHFKVRNPLQGKQSLFQKLETRLSLDTVFEDGLPVKYLPYILFVAGLVLFYIGNSHYAEKTIRKIDRLETEVEDLRADYTTLKAEYMVSSKQSEVARQVEGLGLYESDTPPFKVVMREE